MLFAYSGIVAQNLEKRKPVAGASSPNISKNMDGALRTLALMIARAHLEKLNSPGDISMQYSAQGKPSRKTERKGVIKDAEATAFPKARRRAGKRGARP